MTPKLAATIDEIHIATYQWLYLFPSKTEELAKIAFKNCAKLLALQAWNWLEKYEEKVDFTLEELMEAV